MSNKTQGFKKLRFILSTLKFNRADFFNGLQIGILLSLFIYFEHFDLNLLILNSIIAIYAYYRLLTANQGTLIVSAFIMGLLWFYWVGFSFIYVDMPWAIPLVAIFFATGYALSFWVIGFSQAIYFRVVLIFLLSFYNPLYFDWFRPELLLVNSYFGVQLWQYALILISLALFIYFKKQKWAPLSFLLLLASIDYSSASVQKVPLDVAITQTNIDQKKKWLPSERASIVAMNFDKIEKAIADNKELIILPESTLPLYLNLAPALQNRLKEYSYAIDIIIGSLFAERRKSYNATYYYSQGVEKIGKKMILVPFGEYIPLPKFLRKYINDLIFQGGEDYETADAPTDFIIKGTRIRSAICYEATAEIFYQGDVDYLIAISNNQWFQPSTEPTLQKLIIKLYAKRHGVTVMHSINGSQSMVIYP